MQQRLVAGRFIVESEICAIMADLHNAARIFQPFTHLLRLWRRCFPGIGRQQRIAEKRVLDVGEDQFLMLLFVMQAQSDARRQGIVVQPQQQ